MSQRSLSTPIFVTLTLSIPAAVITHAASALPIHRVHYEIYNDQQSALRDAPSDLQPLATDQTPPELRFATREQSRDASSEPQSEQAASPEQQNAFVSEKSTGSRGVAQVHQDEQAQQKSPELQSQRAAPASAASDDDVCNE